MSCIRTAALIVCDCSFADMRPNLPLYTGRRETVEDFLRKKLRKVLGRIVTSRPSLPGIAIRRYAILPRHGNRPGASGPECLSSPVTDEHTAGEVFCSTELWRVSCWLVRGQPQHYESFAAPDPG